MKQQQGFNAALKKVSDLMIRASTLKNAAQLRTLTDLAPVKHNATRWMSEYYMIKRYFEIQCELNLIEELAMLIPHAYDNTVLTKAMESLKEIMDFTLHFQKKGVTLDDYRYCCDTLIAKYSDMNHHLNKVYGPSATFESAVVKIATDKVDTMSQEEFAAAGPLLAKDDNIEQQQEPDDNTPLSLFEQMQKKQKKEGGYTKRKYIDVSFIVGSSCSAERLFSTAGNVLTDCRKSMNSDLFEALIILKCNDFLWNAGTVGIAMNTKTSDDDHM
jgi:hypothetical protein